MNSPMTKKISIAKIATVLNCLFKYAIATCWIDVAISCIVVDPGFSLRTWITRKIAKPNAIKLATIAATVRSIFVWLDSEIKDHNL